MAVFVINEWLLDDLAGGNGPEEQLKSFDLLRAFAVSSHTMVVLTGSTFDQKAWSLCKSHKTVPLQAGRYFRLAIRQGSERGLWIHSEAVAILPEWAGESVKPDDHYLVQAMDTVPGAVLITTDGDLRRVMSDHGYDTRDRKEFLEEYFGLDP